MSSLSWVRTCHGSDEQRVEVVAHDGGLRREARHPREPLQLLHRDLVRLDGQPRLLDPLAELLDLRCLVRGVAELLADRLELFVEVELLLVLLDLALDVALDLLFELEDLELLGEQPCRCVLNRSSISTASRIGCFTSILAMRCAAIESASRSKSSIGITDRSTSSGMRLFSWTYSVNWLVTLRTSARISRAPDGFGVWITPLWRETASSIPSTSRPRRARDPPRGSASFPRRDA